jgi:cytochrome c553
MISFIAACGTIATPAWQMPTATPSLLPPTRTPPTPIDPTTATVGRWQWTSFISATETYPPAQLWIDVDDLGGVNGVLSIYPNYPEIPPAALTLIQQNGCNFTVGSLSDPSVSGFFYTETQARIRVNVTECTVKFYGPVTLLAPLVGEFDIAYDAELTDLILHPRELTPIERGLRIFVQYCSACHGSYAEGMPGIPSLHTDQVRNYTDEQLDNIVRNGVVNTVMPAWGKVLSPEDFAGVIELVRNIDEVLRG